MICASGHYEYDENLVGYYDFSKYGEQRISQEDGEVNCHGYIILPYGNTLRTVRVPSAAWFASHPRLKPFLGCGIKARFADHSGERTVRIRKVESSILFVSTMKTAKSNDLAVFS